MIELIEAYDTDAEALRSFYNLSGAQRGLERLDEFDEGWLARLEAVDYAALSVAECIDWQLLRSHIVYAKTLRERQRERRAASAELLAFHADIVRLEEARWELAPLEAQAAAARVAAIADAVEDIIERTHKLGATSEDEEPANEAARIELGAVDALRAARWVESAAHALETWYTHYAAFEPEFSWWVEEPYERANTALENLTKELREELAEQRGEDDDPLVGAPIGRAALLEDLAAAHLAYTPEELIAIGESEFDWCLARLIEAAQEMGLQGDWRAALEEVKQAYVPPGGQAELVASQAREMIAWLDEHELVTIPELCRETWRIKMLDKRAQRTLPFAAYGGQKMLVAYATDDMSHAEKLMSLRGNNAHFVRCVTPHELIPGHHLQGFMARRHATHRRPFRTPFLVEGWALYWEMLEWDQGWAKSPEDRIGMLFWRLHRAARIIVSLEFHLGEMSPEEMIEFLVERVGHERDNATAEVRRYISDRYSALYQCGYMIGGLQLRALSAELVGTSQLSPKQFHDAVLRENAIPIELIRASLLGQRPTRDGTPSWRFDADD